MPNEPTNLRYGAGVPGLPARTYIHVVWDAPPERQYNLLPITHYLLFLSSPSSPLTEQVLLNLNSGQGGGGTWAGPAAGHIITRLNNAPLVPGQNVSIAARACNSLGCGGDSLTAVLKTEDWVPGPVLPPYLIDLNATTIVAQLGSPAAYTGGQPILRYEVAVASRPWEISETLTISPDTPSTFHISNRRLDLAYVFKVRAVNALGVSVWSNDLVVESATLDLPLVPEALGIPPSSVAARSMTLSWSMPQSNRSVVPLFYRVELQRVACANGPTDCFNDMAYSTATTELVVVRNVAACTTACSAQVVTGVLPAHRYKVRISSVTSGGASLPSQPAYAITLADVPTFAAAPIVTSITETSIGLSWTPTVDNGAPVLGHAVWACDVQSAVCLSFNSSASATDAIVGLPSGRNYTLALEAINSVGSSGNTSAAGVHTTRAVPMQGNPVAKTSLLPGLSPRNTMRVMWAAPYDNGLPISEYALNLDGVDRTVPASDPQYLATDLYPGSWHNFSVRAINSLGAGSASPIMTYMTNVDVPGVMPQPSLLTLNLTHIHLKLHPPLYHGGGVLIQHDLMMTVGDDVNGTVVPVAWRECSDVVVNASTNASTTTTTAATITTCSVLDVNPPTWALDGPMPTTLYRFRARTVSDIGVGAWSTEFAVNSLAPLPPASPPANPPLPPLAPVGCQFSPPASPGFQGANGTGGQQAAGDEGGPGALGAKGDGGDAAAGDEGGPGAAGAKGDGGDAAAGDEGGPGAAGADGNGGDAAAGDEGGPGAAGADGVGGDQAAGDTGGEGTGANECGATEDEATASCAGPNEMCFRDPACLGNVATDPFGGLGCNAGGYQACRFCGFGPFKSIACPGGALGVDGDGALGGVASALTGSAGGMPPGMMYLSIGAGLFVISVILCCYAVCKARSGGAMKVAKLRAELKAAKAGADAAGSMQKAAGLGAGMEQLQKQLTEIRAKIEAEGGDADEALKQLERGLTSQLKNLEAQLQETLAQGRNSELLAAQAAAGGGDDAKANVVHKEMLDEEARVEKLKHAMYAQGHFESGVDDQAGMEVNPLMLHNIMVEKREAREANQEKIRRSTIQQAEVITARRGRPKQFGHSGGLARLNLSIDKQSGGDGNLETLKSVQAYLSGQGVQHAQDKAREHCTKPGAFGATATAAAQAYMADAEHVGMMAHAARQRRLQTKPAPNANVRITRTSDADPDGGEDRANLQI